MVALVGGPIPAAGSPDVPVLVAEVGDDAVGADALPDSGEASVASEVPCGAGGVLAPDEADDVPVDVAVGWAGLAPGSDPEFAGAGGSSDGPEHGVAAEGEAGGVGDGVGPDGVDCLLGVP